MTVYAKHSYDYKTVVISHYLKHGSFRKTCQLFKCNKSTLYDWITHDINKHIVHKQPIKIKDKIVKFMVKYVNTNVTTTLKQLSEIIKQKFKISISLMAIHNILRKNNFTRKRLVKKYFPAKKKQIEKDLLSQFYKNVKKYDYQKVICLDETAVYINMLPEYGRSLIGTKAIRRTNIYPYKKFNLMIAMKYNKIIGLELSKTPYNTDKLCNFIDDKLSKYKKHLLIFDNAYFHKSKNVINKLNKYKIAHQYIVPYHPENNPIERLFSQIKSYLKIANGQSFDDIYNKIVYILKHNITRNNLTKYIKTLY